MLINGKEMDFPSGLTVEELLEKLKLHRDKIVVEVNYEIVAKESFKDRVLNQEDRIEIVRFVGGG